MPFTIERQPAVGGVIATERTYADAEGNIVGEDDPKKVTLVAAAGLPVPKEYEAACAAQAVEEKQAAGQPDNTLPEAPLPGKPPEPPLGGNAPAQKPDPGLRPGNELPETPEPKRGR
jgi:hypothetical protein